MSDADDPSDAVCALGKALRGYMSDDEVREALEAMRLVAAGGLSFRQCGNPAGSCQRAGWERIFPAEAAVEAENCTGNLNEIIA